MQSVATKCDVVRVFTDMGWCKRFFSAFKELKTGSTSRVSVGPWGEYCDVPLQVASPGCFFHGLNHDQLLTLLWTTIMAPATLGCFDVHVGERS